MAPFDAPTTQDAPPPSTFRPNVDYVPLYQAEPAHWLYDLDPANGISRATYLGELFYGGQAAGNQVATKGDIAAATAGVASFNTRTGAVVLTTADVTGAGGAPIASPTFTGTPAAPTATAGTNTTQLATTQFVTSAVSNAVTSFNGRTGAVTLNITDIGNAGGAPINNPSFTGGVYCGGALQVAGLLTASNVTVAGQVQAANLIATSNASVTGTTTTGYLTVNNPATMNGVTTSSLTVTGATQVNTLAVTGAATVSGLLSGNNLTMAGQVQGAALISTGDCDASGTVNAGALSVSTSTTLSALTVNSAATFNGATTFGNQANFNGAVTINTTTSFQCAMIQCNSNNAAKTTSGPWNAITSDVRTKVVLGAYRRGLDDLLRLQPRIISYRGNVEIDGVDVHREIKGRPMVEYVAQEVELVWPEMVGKRDAVLDGEAVDDLRTLDTREVSYALVNAVGELDDKIRRLERMLGTRL